MCFLATLLTIKKHFLYNNLKKKMHNLKIIPTADGSKTIFNPAIGENYHSKHGALQESLHVFVGNGLQYFLNNYNHTQVSMLEVGFGTGLNFLTSANYCSQHPIKLYWHRSFSAFL
jgi:tRNA U34 5-methylaminomethyl-2-thiouridine-forming methyltransferase MnmC